MAKTWNLTSASNLFKTKFGKLSENVYNSSTVLLARTKKSYNFTGDSLFIPVPVAFQGGVGSGSLPKANAANAGKALLTRKAVYARVTISREAIKASSNDEGAFVKGLKHVVQKGVESYMRNMSRILFNDGSGALGTADSSETAPASGQLEVVITAATFKEANFEENDYVNIGTSTDLQEIVAVDPATRTITLEAVTGSLPTLTGDQVIYMQGSKDSDPQGLKGVCDATSGTLYNIPVNRRWQATQIAAGGAAITEDLMDQGVLEIQRKSGKVVNLVITSFNQFRKIKALSVSQKRYNIEPRDKKLIGKVSMSGIELMTSTGAVPIVPERFCENDRVYLLNDNFIEIHHAPDFGWFDDDGTVFLREADSDNYEARYGGYLEVFITPTFQGVITGLAL